MPVTKVPSPPQVNQSDTGVVKAELAVARAEIELTRKFQDQLLSTVYWSLGTLAAVAALLVGYSWWNNSKNYERDKTVFEREVRALLAETATKVSEEQRTSIQSKMDRAELQLNERSQLFETKMASDLNNSLDESKKQFATQITQLKSSVAGLRTEVDKLHLEKQLQERLKSKASGSLRNALQYSVTALEMAIKIRDDYEIGNVLDLISEDVTAILSGKDLPIDNFLIGQLVEVLDTIKGQHAHAAAILKSKAPQMLIK